MSRACAEIKKWPTSLGFSIFGIFFSPFLFLLFSFWLQWLTFYWACLQLKNFWESIRQAIFSMEQPGVVAGNFAMSFSLNFLSFFVHIQGSIRLITLIWASLERSFPPAEVEYRWCQIWSKVMRSEEEKRPRFVMGGYGRHRHQWVRQWRWPKALTTHIASKLWSGTFYPTPRTAATGQLVQRVLSTE